MTIAVHLLTGYLALLSLGVLALLRPRRLVRGIGRAALVGVGAVLIAAWVVVPLLLDRAYTVQDEFSRGKVFYDSFGARQIMAWLGTGQIFDRNRFPVISLLAAVGLILCVWRWRRDVRARAVVALGVLSLLLFFGRSTLGPVLRLLPGSGDLFLRRYVFGVHLAGLFLVGFALAWLGGIVVRRVRRRVPRLEVVVAALVGVALVVLSPAWLERGAWAAQGARWIHEQDRFDATDGADFATLVAIAERRGPGRIYAGERSNWGTEYRIGQVPGYVGLLNLDALGLGFTRPTWSLSSPAEYRFRETSPAHFDVFDVRYVIQPIDQSPPIGGELVAERGRHALYEMPVDGAIEIVDTTDPIRADRTDLGVRIDPWLDSDLPEANVHPGIAFGRFEAVGSTLTGGQLPVDRAGRILETSLALDQGRASTIVELDRPAAVILKASFDNRWRVTLDGRDLEPQMFAPTFVGRLVPPGRHEVSFEYAPFPRYDLLLLIGAGTFAALLIVPRRRASARAAAGMPSGTPDSREPVQTSP
jgi:hypothetical protein